MNTLLLLIYILFKKKYDDNYIVLIWLVFNYENIK